MALAFSESADSSARMASDIKCPGAVGAARGVATKEIASMQDQPNGLCQCGCGRKTRISSVSHATRGLVRGMPVKYIHGHNRRQGQGPEYVVDANGCWVWQMAIDAKGYGMKGGGGAGHHVLAHRWHYERAHGSVPDGLELDHLCRNRACVNPSHLEAVSHATNCQRGSWVKLDWDKVRHIRASSETNAELARRYGVTSTAVGYVRQHKTWRED